jgi:hypothetical protein
LCHCIMPVAASCPGAAVRRRRKRSRTPYILHPVSPLGAASCRGTIIICLCEHPKLWRRVRGDLIFAFQFPPLAKEGQGGFSICFFLRHSRHRSGLPRRSSDE